MRQSGAGSNINIKVRHLQIPIIQWIFITSIMYCKIMVVWEQKSWNHVGLILISHSGLESNFTIDFHHLSLYFHSDEQRQEQESKCTHGTRI